MNKYFYFSKWVLNIYFRVDSAQCIYKMTVVVKIIVLYFIIFLVHIVCSYEENVLRHRNIDFQIDDMIDYIIWMLTKTSRFSIFAL